jgi:hypothetical protein
VIVPGEPSAEDPDRHLSGLLGPVMGRVDRLLEQQRRYRILA